MRKHVRRIKCAQWHSISKRWLIRFCDRALEEHVRDSLISAGLFIK